MTRITSIILTLLLAINIKTNAQDEHIVQTDKKVSHVFGVQANELIRQLFNLGNAPDVNNPFLFKYATRFNASNVEIGAGLGYNSFTRNDDASSLSKGSDFHFRLGVAKKYLIGKRFEAGFGIDAISILTNAENETKINNGNSTFIDSVHTKSTSKSNVFGGGPQLTLAFYINKNIKIGTETTAYFLYGEAVNENKTSRTVSNGLQEVTTTNEERDNIFFTDTRITLPVAIFLSVRF